MDRDYNYPINANQMFYIAIMSNILYKLTINMTNHVIEALLHIQVDYNHLRIYYSYCLSTSDLRMKCHVLSKQRQRGSTEENKKEISSRVNPTLPKEVVDQLTTID